MPKSGRMWKNDERRVRVDPHDPRRPIRDEEEGLLICAVRKRHGPWYIVRECYPYLPARGEACRDVEHSVNRMESRCTCGGAWPCLHAAVVLQADPLGGQAHGGDPMDYYGSPGRRS